MNREEVVKLLMVLSANYPNARIKDAAQTADAWQMVLSPYNAESVYKAARLHMNASKFFPTPADIREKLTRAELIYNGPPLGALEAPKVDPKESEYLEALCKFVGLGYDEPDINALDNFSGFMDWEL